MNEIKEIKKLTDKETLIDRPLMVKDKFKGLGKNGKLYMSLLLGDKTGHIDARIWDQVEKIDEQIQVGDIVIVKGQVQLYMNRKQIVIHKIEKDLSNQFSVDDFSIAEKKVDSHVTYAKLIQIVDQIESDKIKQLILDILNDQDIKNRLLKAPAAKTIHHAFKGGLLEHIVSICYFMKFISQHYKDLNEDLLIFGAIFHDIGKVWELDIQNDMIQYSHEGRLLGHMQLACELIDKKSQKILGFPEDLKHVLKHIVLSHHNKLEYGSPVRPQFLEAMIVAMVDELDSKIDTVAEFIKQERLTGELWSRYNENFERYFYLEPMKGRWV